MRHLMSGSALPIRPPHFCTFPRYGRTIFGRRGRVLERRHHGSGGGQRADHDHGDDDQHQSPAEHLHQRPENTPPVRPDGSRPRGRPAPVWGLGVREIYRTSRTNKAARALEYWHDGISSRFSPFNVAQSLFVVVVALSSNKTIAELWNSRSRVGHWSGCIRRAGGRVVSPRGPRQDCLFGQPLKAGSALEADYGAPMPGHPTQGEDTRQSSRLRGVPDRGTPSPLPRRHQSGMHSSRGKRQEDGDTTYDGEYDIGIRRGRNSWVGCAQWPLHLSKTKRKYQMTPLRK